jgi:hypothetical protein
MEQGRVARRYTGYEGTGTGRLRESAGPIGVTGRFAPERRAAKVARRGRVAYLCKAWLGARARPSGDCP